MNYLIGKLVLVEDGECYRTGEIVAMVDEHFYVVRFDNMAAKIPAKSTTLVCLHEMAETYGEDIKAWSFFDSRKDLQDYVDWLDAPTKPVVAKLVPSKAH